MENFKIYGLLPIKHHKDILIDFIPGYLHLILNFMILQHKDRHKLLISTILSVWNYV